MIWWVFTFFFAIYLNDIINLQFRTTSLCIHCINIQKKFKSKLSKSHLCITIYAPPTPFSAGIDGPPFLSPWTFSFVCLSPSYLILVPNSDTSINISFNFFSSSFEYSFPSGIVFISFILPSSTQYSITWL